MSACFFASFRSLPDTTPAADDGWRCGGHGSDAGPDATAAFTRNAPWADVGAQLLDWGLAAGAAEDDPRILLVFEGGSKELVGLAAHERVFLGTSDADKLRPRSSTLSPFRALQTSRPRPRAREIRIRTSLHPARDGASSLDRRSAHRVVVNASLSRTSIVRTVAWASHATQIQTAVARSSASEPRRRRATRSFTNRRHYLRGRLHVRVP